MCAPLLLKWHIRSRASTTAGCRDLNPPPSFVVVQLCDGSIIGATHLSKAYLTFLENNLSCTRVLCIHIKPQGSCTNKPLRALFCTTVYQRNEMLGRTLQQKHGLSLETELKPHMYELKRSWLYRNKWNLCSCQCMLCSRSCIDYLNFRFHCIVLQDVVGHYLF